MGSNRRIACPFCDREYSATFNTLKGVGWCHRCKRPIQEQHLKAAVEEALSFTRAVSSRPNLHLVAAHEDLDASIYLRKRGVNPQSVASDISYCPELRRLFFRITSPNKQYMPTWHTRGIDEGHGWIVYPGTLRAHYWFGVRTASPVLTLCEGIFDALRLRNEGVPAVALLGTQMSMTHLAGIHEAAGPLVLRQVVVWLDDLLEDGSHDIAGVGARDKIAKQLTFVQRVVVIEGYPEPSESREIPLDCYVEAS